MSAEQTRAFHRHVRVQIECLISGAKLVLSSGSDDAAASLAPHTAPKGLQTNEAGSIEQTTAAPDRSAAPDPAGSADSERCRRALVWSDEAQRRLNQLDGKIAFNGAPEPLGEGGQTATATFVEQLDGLSDASKQMAAINWIQAQCLEFANSCFKQTQADDFHACELGNKLRRAVGFAWKSRVTIEAKIYIDYAEFLLRLEGGTGEAERALGVLRRSVEIEEAKLAYWRQLKRDFSPKSAQLELGRLRYRLAKLAPRREALRQLEEACRRQSGQFQWLTLAGQVAYELELVDKSRRFYASALKVAQRDYQTQEEETNRKTERRKLASAHANYGAILQVNGKLKEARQQYRRSLDCDPLNKVAATNLAKLDGVSSL